MRELSVKEVKDALLRLVEKASFDLGEAELASLNDAAAREKSAIGRAILSDIQQNAEIAKSERRPLCQDTGVAVIFLDVGQELHLTGGDLAEAVQDAVAEGYKRFYLRKSILDHPLTRKNTGTNTPAILHARIVPGDRLRIRFAAKGGGCENMSRLAMLPPSAGRDGVIEFVVRAVREAGGNPCPPVIVGVGLGGNFEKCALLAKESLLRPLGQQAANPSDAELERELLAKINAIGVGPMGLGGEVTALAVHVESAPCHLAALPVAVNLDCHSHRHAEATL